jgi:hypothetical protein
MYPLAGFFSGSRAGKYLVGMLYLMWKMIGKVIIPVI